MSIREMLTTEDLPPAFLKTVASVHIPLANWILRRHADLGRCCIVGISGPQGSGKSTAARVLAILLEGAGLRVSTLSIDDLYLPRSKRLKLASSVHPLLNTRGPPGTHDVSLGEGLLDCLREGARVAIPRFDKKLDDITPKLTWAPFEGPADVVLFEGWCVGACPQVEADLISPMNALERDEDAAGIWRRYVNSALETYQPLFSRLDLLVQFIPPSFDVVAGWRLQQEEKLRAQQEGTSVYPCLMKRAEIYRFVSHYERLSKHMLDEMPARADAIVRLDEDRLPLELRFRLSH